MKFIQSSVIYFYCLILFLGLAGCVSPYSQDQAFDSISDKQDSLSPQTEKQGPRGLAVNSESEHENKSDSASFDSKKLGPFIRTLAAPHAQMNLEEENLWLNLPLTYPSGSLVEAAHVIGLFIKSTSFDSYESSFKQGENKLRSDHDENNLANFDLAKDFEKISFFLREESKNRNLDLPFVLLRNSFLQSRGFFHLIRSVLSPLDKAKKDPYLGSVVQVLAQNLQLWSDVYKDFADINLNSDLPEIAVEDLKSISYKEKGPLDFDLSDDQEAENLIDQAKKLIVDRKYSGAIKILSRFEEDSIYFSIAHEKVKEASDLGVKRYRVQAAKSFQSAIPLVNKASRLRYLEEAKAYLLRAIEEFPQSDQLDTVQQNIGVIDKNLELIKSQSLDSSREKSLDSKSDSSQVFSE